MANSDRSFHSRPSTFLAWLSSLLLALPVAVAAAQDAEDAAPSNPAAQAAPTKTVQLGDVALTIPAVLDVAKVAGEPLVKWPIVADWDPQGRLVVVESGGVSRPIDQHNLQRLHRVVRLIDDDGDGTFDRRLLAADQLPFAEGVLCIGNSLLVAAPPQIFRLTDEDGDGFCERREVWFDGQTITGCANDLHGPYEGRDGWIYWCKGAFAEQTHELSDGRKLVTTAAHVFRRRLEGGPLEPVMTGGMDNPVELAITPAGERFFTSTFLQHPSDGLRDGIAHAIYGGVYGKPHRVIDGHLRTGDLMPIMTQLGAAAPSGLIYLDARPIASSLLPDHPHVLAAALFNHHKVTLHGLEPQGAGFRSADRDLLISDRIDFHPTDVIEAADGSLIVIDTGGWYDLCCPSSRVDQKAASGGIYRLTAAGGPRTVTGGEATANGGDAPSSGDRAILARLDDLASRGTVARRAATAWLVAHAEQATPRLIERMRDASAGERHRIEALWVLCRIGSPQALHAITDVLASESQSAELATAAAHAVGVHRWSDAETVLQDTVASDAAAPIRRAAAEALGRVGGSTAVAPLMQAITTVGDDRALEHSVLYALMEVQGREPRATHGDQPEAMRAFLDDEHPRRRQAVLRVISETRPGTIPVAAIFTAARTADAGLRETALGILGQQPASPAPDHVLREIDAAWNGGNVSDSDLPILRAIVGGWGGQPEIQTRLAAWIEAAADTDGPRQDTLAQLLAEYNGTALPAAWTTPLANWLAATDDQRAVALAAWLRRYTASSAGESELSRVLLKRAAANQESPATAAALLAALPRRTPVAAASLAAVVVDGFVQTADPVLASRAAEALDRITLPKSEAQRLLAALGELQPLQLPIAIEAINRLQDDELDAEMLARLESIRAARTLAAAQITNLYRARDARLKNQAVALVAALTEPTPDVRKKVEATLAQLEPGDPVKGYEVFRNSKAACSACHKIGYIGRSIGPDLTRIGGTRTRYDLLEAILYPSSRLEQSYQPTSIVTVDGRVINGLVKRESDGQIELVTGPNQTVILAVADVEERVPSEVSIMPSGLAEQITLEELSHLLALLQAAK